MKIFRTIAVLAIVLIAGASIAADIGESGANLNKKAKISLQEARFFALKVFPGKISDEELENEKGGSGLRYSFDIKNGSVTQEVGVDAITGEVLENTPEGKNPD
ncbi:MAG TPA: PepSY domain-containing protein [Spongiibacteraceae bacterium]|jgi:uncharacterized membrane protein YkoI